MVANKSFKMIDDEKLITEVQAYPVLYDTTSANYKDNNRRDNVWSQIGETLCVSGKEQL